MLTVSYKYWHGGWIDATGTNGKGIRGTCSEGKQSGYTTAEKCNTEHKERWGVPWDRPQETEHVAKAGYGRIISAHFDSFWQRLCVLLRNTRLSDQVDDLLHDQVVPTIDE